ncbi:SDR family oxidoreductase [Sphingosinicella rhizophila]|uniref:SDR family oxidoreductase n=1 Tax=Sphingosinicella rhizophila TaxID=3050082 RepID=A0ABU3QB47_9SPHN|nr:SDR family oxidoreductase [Sphingosinicella sp. GR2756]MDT9600379.1 SDR family oxidoreductase [Sphingosinicella sp. GR2756]
MDLKIAGRTALVTGASGGLGLAIARGLAAEGVKVAVSSRSSERIEAAAETIGHGAVPLVCDMTDHKARAALVDEAASRLGPLDILVINSGGPPSGPFESHDDRRFAAALDEHLGGAVALTRSALPSMRERRWGRILTITSCMLKQPAAGMILSNVARAAVAAFVKTCANESARDGVTVNNLLPGYTLTGRIAELSGQMAETTGRSAGDVIGDWEAQIPVGRLGTPEEFAAAAAFLCSEQAAYITGISLSVDGGWNRGLF